MCVGVSVGEWGVDVWYPNSDFEEALLLSELHSRCYTHKNKSEKQLCYDV